MNLEDYRRVFSAGSLVLILIVASPSLGLIMPFRRGTERFSELWVLGPNHMAEDYPSTFMLMSRIVFLLVWAIIWVFHHSI